MPAFEGGGTIACDGGWFSMSQTSFAVGKGFTFGENVASQQRTFRHETDELFRATFLRRKAEIQQHCSAKLN